MSSLRERLVARADRDCIPLSVTLELTLRCNLRCVHCYNFDRAQPLLPAWRSEGELTDDEVLRILDEVAAEGCLYLALSGGEAMVHPSLSLFVEHGARLGLAVTVKTNGLLLNDDSVRELRDAGATGVEVSLYGATASTHDALVRGPGAFDRTRAGIDAALRGGLGVKLSLVAFEGNAGELSAMVDWATGRGCGFTVDPQLTARYDATREPLGLQLRRETLLALYRGPLRSLVPAPMSNGASLQCSCARTVAGISAFGEVYPCIGAPVPSGNLRQRSFGDLWRNSPTLRWIRGLRDRDFGTCTGCSHRAHCRRSSGVIYTNTGDYTGPPRLGDDWTCLEAEVLHQLHEEGIGLEGDAGAGALRRHSVDRGG